MLLTCPLLLFDAEHVLACIEDGSIDDHSLERAVQGLVAGVLLLYELAGTFSMVVK